VKISGYSVPVNTIISFSLKVVLAYTNVLAPAYNDGERRKQTQFCGAGAGCEKNNNS